MKLDLDALEEEATFFKDQVCDLDAKAMLALIRIARAAAVAAKEGPMGGNYEDLEDLDKALRDAGLAD